MLKNKKTCKRVLIVIPSFGHGGTSRSLFNLLSSIDTSNYEIEIFSANPEGYYKDILPNCKILPHNKYLAFIIKGSRIVGYKKVGLYMILIMNKIIKFLTGKSIIDYLMISVANKLSKKEYNTVIAFSEGMPTKLVANISSTNKIAWLRCEYSRYLNLNKIQPEHQIYEKYNHIVCVSNYTSDNFISLLPNLSNQVHAIHNIINSDSILRLSKEMNYFDLKFQKAKFNIISVGRIDDVKRFSSIPSIAKTIKDTNIDFKWFIIGTAANSHESILFFNNIEIYNVSDVVVFLGAQNNPYPYIAQCDLLVSTSSSEACPNVINEARILHIPVITTNFGSASEFVTPDIGIITEIELIAEQILHLMTSNETYQSIKNAISHFTYDNALSLNKIEDIL